MKRGAKTIIPIAAVALILLAGVGFYNAIQSAKQQVTVMVAAKNIAAYTLVQPADLTAQSVPKGSVTSQDITQAAYQTAYVTAHKPLITTLQVLAGDRLDSRAVAKNSQSSFDVVSADERVVAVTATMPGAAIGTINAGDVVDAQVNGAGGGTSGAGTTFAKVICISASASGCAGVLPPGVQLSVTSGSSTTAPSNSSTVNVLLAVASADAAGIAGQQVNIALNPFCKVGSTDRTVRPDQFVSARPKDPNALCQAPSNRLASTGGTTPATPAAATSTTSTKPTH